MLNQERGNVDLERYYFARSGNVYYGLVRWDYYHKENDQWLPVARAVGKRTGYLSQFGRFEGFFERANLNDFLVDSPDVCQYTGVYSVGDIDGDCSVDIDDLQMICDKWLTCNSIVNDCF